VRDGQSACSPTSPRHWLWLTGPRCRRLSRLLVPFFPPSVSAPLGHFSRRRPSSAAGNPPARWDPSTLYADGLRTLPLTDGCPLPWAHPSTPPTAGITRRVGDGGAVTRKTNERDQVIAYAHIQEVFWGFRSNFLKSHARHSQVLSGMYRGRYKRTPQHSQLPTVTDAN